MLNIFIIALIIDKFFFLIRYKEVKNFSKKDIELQKKISSEKKKNNLFLYKLNLFFNIFFQVIICVIAIFYLRKLIQHLPFIKKHVKNITNSIFDGEIVISFIFIGTQYNLLDNLIDIAS